MIIQQKILTLYRALLIKKKKTIIQKIKRKDYSL